MDTLLSKTTPHQRQIDRGVDANEAPVCNEKGPYQALFLNALMHKVQMSPCSIVFSIELCKFGTSPVFFIIHLI